MGRSDQMYNGFNGFTVTYAKVVYYVYSCNINRK